MWSCDAVGAAFGGYGGGCANEFPSLVYTYQEHAEMVKAMVFAVDGLPHSACAQAFTLLPW